MNEMIKFKKAFFGYSKKSVNDYIESLNNECVNAVEDKNDEIDELKTETENLKQENDRLKKRLEEVSDKALCVGETILIAKERADEIIAEAEKEAVERKRTIELEIKEASMVLKKMNAEIKQIKSSVADSVSKYQSELDTILKYTERTEN